MPRAVLEDKGEILCTIAPSHDNASLRMSSLDRRTGKSPSRTHSPGIRNALTIRPE